MTTPSPKDRYWLVARDKPALLMHTMRFLAGDAHISFEGDLSRCDFPASIPCIADQQSILRRRTAYPLQFGSYDQFHHECIVCFLGVPTEFLDELQQKGILKSWT